jgi:hypothetical protein
MDNPEGFDNDPGYDVVDDLVVFMKNDPQFYRRRLYPALVNVANHYRKKKKINRGALEPVVDQATQAYCKKFKILKDPDELFSDEDKQAVIDQIFSEEMDDIKGGEY